MTAARKLKISLTLSSDLLEVIDRDASRRQETRSAVVEQWLRRASARAIESEIDDAMARYYMSLRKDERADDEAVARAASRASRRLAYDEPKARSRRGRS